MFSMTGVTQPNLDVGSLQTLSQHYSTLATGAADAHQDTLAAAAAVMADNDGPGATAFDTAARGGGSIGEHMGVLADAATRTSTAYSTAAKDGGSAQTAMILLAHDREVIYWEKFFEGTDVNALSLLIQVTRNQLLQLEADGVGKINAAFANLNLPGPFAISDVDEGGRLDEGIEERWAELTDEQRIAVLQKMADAYADANGFPRIKIQFNPLAEKKNEILWGQYDPDYFWGPKLELNSKHLSNPHMINTVIHEMQHRAQRTGMGFRFPWEDEKNGMSRAEAERWRELNSDHVRHKGGPGKWDYYPPRPIEVDARDAGRNYIDNLTLEEFEGYVD